MSIRDVELVCDVCGGETLATEGCYSPRCSKCGGARRVVKVHEGGFRQRVRDFGLRRSLSRVLTRGANVLSTLARLLAPPEPSESSARGSDMPLCVRCLERDAQIDDLCCPCEEAEFQRAGANHWNSPPSPMVVTPEAEAMLATPQPRPVPPPPPAPLRGSIADRAALHRELSHDEFFRTGPPRAG